MSSRAESAHGGVLPTALLLTFLSLVLVVGCGGRSSPVESSPTPRIAPSVAATSLPDPAMSSVLQARIVSVSLKDPLKPKQRARLADQIARMPEVQEFAFVSRRLAWMRLLERRGITVWLRPILLPASFEIIVKSRDDVLPVARRFFNDPLVDNDPHTHDGVAFINHPASP
jgi:FtsX extracellular domain